MVTPELPFATVQNVLSHYFAFCNEQPFSFFNREALLKRHLDGQIPAALMLAILSSAICFATGEGVPAAPQRLARHLANEGWRLLAQPAKTDAPAEQLARLQALVLLAIFDFAGPLHPTL